MCFLRCGIQAETPVAEDFPSLAEVGRRLDVPVSGDFASARIDKKPATVPSQNPAGCIPAKSPVLAFEENAHFLSAVVDLSNTLSPARNSADKKKLPTLLRRLIFLKPSIWVIEDVISEEAGDGTLRWEIHRWENPDTNVPELQCNLLWPASESPPSAADEIDSPCSLHVLHPSANRADPALVKTVLTNNDDRLDLTITSVDRVYQLQLPRLNTGAGQIVINDADGKALVPLRPLPAGVLPHGPEGMKLIERWDKAYRNGRQPPWNSGMVAPDLRKAVEEGDIKPCRVVVLGCGSGMNSIYLAKQGFDVTAIDVAPTALSIAEAEARKAGVKVKCLLADVLALPELEPFDLIFDRGCYHNVRYVNAKGFLASLDRLSRPGTRFFVLSCDRDSAPGVREPTMREDFSSQFDFEWIRKSNIITGREGQKRRASWSVMLRKKKE